jgi:hypothetical protein
VLVEAFVPVAAGQVLEVRARGAHGGEPLRGVRREVTGRYEGVEPLLRYRPTLGLGERLPQVREVRERCHVRNPEAGQVRA